MQDPIFVNILCFKIQMSLMLWARYFLWKGRIDWLDPCLTLSLTERCLRRQGRPFSAPTVWPAKWLTSEPGWVEVSVFKIPWKATQVSCGTGFHWRNKMVNPNRIFIGEKKKQNGHCQWGFFYWGGKEQNGHCQWVFLLGEWRNKMVNPSGSFIGGKKKQNGHASWGRKKQNDYFWWD